MNLISLRVEVSRENNEQVRIAFFREGEGDDMVDHRATQIEEAIHRKLEELVEEVGGNFLPPKEKSE